MENTIFSGQQAPSAAYDFRVYDQVWQRVTPGVDPYACDDGAMPQHTSQESAPSAPPVPAPPAQAAAAPVQPAPQQEDSLPGADPNPCCMGTDAQDSLTVMEGFIQEELADSRCCQSLSNRVRNQGAAQLMRRIACEKQAAAREMCGAYYLITGKRYAPAITVERMCWNSLAEALRSCYHQEACNGFNYARAADETMDPCLTKLFNRLSQQAYQSAEDVMTLLGRIIC